MRSEGYGSWVSVSPLIEISPLERLFVLKAISRTHPATKFKTPLPALYGSDKQLSVALWTLTLLAIARASTSYPVSAEKLQFNGLEQATNFWPDQFLDAYFKRTVRWIFFQSVARLHYYWYTKNDCNTLVRVDTRLKNKEVAKECYFRTKD